MSFNQFRLSSDILKGLKDMDIESPSSLQKKIYKAVKEGPDLVINARPDEKPEAGYLLSMLNEIAKSDRRQGTRAVVLTAEDDRADALRKWIEEVGTHASVNCVCIDGSGEEKDQLSRLSAGPEVIVATPQRFLYLLEEGRIIFREVNQMVVDQAEKIEDWKTVEAISLRIMGKCQRIFTAAKDSKELREAEKSILNDPQLIKAAEKKDTPGTGGDAVITKDLTQYYINVPPRSKISTLMAHLDNHEDDKAVIFTASGRTADRLYKIFRKSNKRVVSIHNKVDSNIFEERFKKFTSGDVQHIVVGDLSAADLPVENTSVVINYDVPEDVQEYKLRAELVGSGKATKILSLVSRQDRNDIQSICKSLGYAPEEIPLPEGVQQSKKRSSPDKRKKGKNKQHTRSNNGKRSSKKKSGKKGSRELNELPRPTFDQLSGGRSGKKKKEEEKGLVGFFKKLFS